MPVRQYLADLAAVGGRILGYAALSDLEDLIPADLLDAYRCAMTSPPSRERRGASLGGTAAATAVAAVLAVDVLSCRDTRTAGRRLRWLVSASRRRGLAVTGSNIGWSRHASDALLAVQICAITAFLPPSDQLRYRCASDYPRRPDPVGERWRSVPAALWPGIRLFFSTPTLGFEQLGSALSVALGLVGTRITLSRAAASLGSVTTAASVSRVLQAMHRDSRWPDMLAALTGLAELLDAGHCPINYAKRRALPFASFLPEEKWRQSCADTAIPVGGAVRIRLVRCWVFERVIGSPARNCTSAIDDPEFRSKLRALPLWMTPHLISSLDHSARRFLDTHGHGGEPLTWQADEHLFEECGLTRTPPTVNTAAVHQAVRNGVRRLSAIADEYGVSIDYLRYVAELFLVTGGSRTAPPNVGVLPALRARLPRETFLDLYVTRRRGLATIAAHVDDALPCGPSRSDAIRVGLQLLQEEQPRPVASPSIDVAQMASARCVTWRVEALLRRTRRVRRQRWRPPTGHKTRARTHRPPGASQGLGRSRDGSPGRPGPQECWLRTSQTRRDWPAPRAVGEKSSRVLLRVRELAASAWAGRVVSSANQLVKQSPAAC